MPEKHELEKKAGELLDHALARYAGEPLSGMEGRTLARLRVERAQQEAAASRFFNRARWMRWLAATTAGAVAVAASLVIGIQIGQHRSDAIWQQRVANTTAWNSVPAVGKATVAPVPAPVIATAKSPRRTLQRAIAPQLTRKAAQFPTPVPLSSQERALARLAANGNPALLASLAQATSKANENLADLSEIDSQPRPPQY